MNTQQRSPKKEKQAQAVGGEPERRRNPARSARNTPRLAVKTRGMRLRRKQKKEKEQELKVDVGEEEDVFSQEPGQVGTHYWQLSYSEYL